MNPPPSGLERGQCWHDGKGVHVRITLRNNAQTRFRRPNALTDSIWASGDFDAAWERCDVVNHSMTSKG